MNKNNVLIDKWVTNIIAVGLLAIFAGVIATAMGIAWNQIVWHAGDPNSYASEFTGIINNIIVFGLGAFFNSVLGKLLGIRNDEMNKSIEQSTKTSKEVGLKAVAQQHDELLESPEVDNDKNS